MAISRELVMIKSLLFILTIIAIIYCVHTPEPVQDSTSFVAAEAASWEAWTNDMPPGPRSLHVTGEVTVSNGRFNAQLKPSEDSTGPGVHCKLEVVDTGGMGTTALTSRNWILETNWRAMVKSPVAWRMPRRRARSARN